MFNIPFGSTEVSQGNPFPVITANSIDIELKNSSNIHDTGSASFFDTNGVLFSATEASPEIDQTVTTNTSTLTGVIELYNVSSANGGTLTHVLTQTSLADSAEFNVIITRDSSNIITIPLQMRRSQNRACLGGFLPIKTASSGENTEQGQQTDLGYGNIPAYTVSPPKSFALGIGLDFESTCIVQLEVVSGNFSTSSTSQSNKSYCAAMLRRRITG